MRIIRVTTERQQRTQETQMTYEFPGPVEKQGVTERTVGPSSLPKKARSNKYTKSLWSFRLKEGNEYAYFGQLYHDKARFYHVLSIQDEDYLEMLDYWDRQEEKTARQTIDNISFAQMNYNATLDENGDAIDPMDKEEYQQWAQQEDSSAGRRIPIKAENAIINSIIKRLSPTDQRVYRYMFEGNYTDAEIKQVFELEHSAWSNEKRRFLEKIRQIFIELGYDVPTLDEVKAQAKKQNGRMAEIEKAKEKAALMADLEQSISRELKCSESTTRSCAFAAEEQAERDTQNGLYEALWEETEEAKAEQTNKAIDKNREN
jgi:hypothetical protein